MSYNVNAIKTNQDFIPEYLIKNPRRKKDYLNFVRPILIQNNSYNEKAMKSLNQDLVNKVIDIRREQQSMVLPGTTAVLGAGIIAAVCLELWPVLLIFGLMALIWTVLCHIAIKHLENDLKNATAELLKKP